MGSIIAAAFPDKFRPAFGDDDARNARILAELPARGRPWVVCVGDEVAGVCYLSRGREPEQWWETWRVLRRHLGWWPALRALLLLGLLGHSGEPSHVMALDTLAVHPRWQGCGLGTLLVRQAIAEAKAAGCRELALWVVASNERARRLYRRLGLRESLPLPTPWLWPTYRVAAIIRMSIALPAGR